MAPILRSIHDRRHQDRQGICQMQVQDGLSIQTQTSRIEDCCLTHGWHLQMIAFDMALSGGLPIEDRPGLAHLLSIITSGDTLMVTELDRLTRDSEVSMIIASQFRRTEPTPIDLYVIGLGRNMIADDERMILEVMATVAQKVIVELPPRTSGDATEHMLHLLSGPAP